jgi:hypothetical protein
MNITHQTETYKPLEEVQSVISTLVENIYNDDSYQDYLKDLKDTDTTVSNKKLDTITKTFTDIKVFNTNKNPLFLSNDIGVILGVSNITAMIKNYTTTEKSIGMLLINNKLVKKTFLTKYGVYRIMFNNKSKLSDVFRAFIYKLLDHMETNGKELARELMDEVNTENPELITEAMDEYNTNLTKYKQMYELERTQNKLLEFTIKSNYELFKDIEEEKLEIEIKQNYNVMYIQQLKKERQAVLEKIYHIKDGIDTTDTAMALESMKKKYLKEFTISLVHPVVMNEVFTSKKFPVSSDDFIIKELTNDVDFSFILQIFNTNGKFNEDEIFYLSIALKSGEKETSNKKISSDQVKETYITSQYITDKTKFSEMLETLQNECEHYYMPGSRKTSNNFIYKTSIEHIKSTANNIIF